MRAAIALVCCLLSFGSSVAQPVPPPPPQPPILDRAAGFRTLRTIEIEADFAQALAFSPDGGTLAVGDGMSVRFWNPRTGKESAEPWQLSGTVKFLAFVDAKTLAVVAAPRASVSVRQYPQGKELARLDCAENEVISCLAVAKGMVAVGTESVAPTVRLFTAPDWRERWCADLPAKNHALALAIGSDKKEVFATASWSGPRALAVADGKPVAGTFGAVKLANPAHVAVSPDGRLFAFGPFTEDRRKLGEGLLCGVTLFDARSRTTRAFTWEGHRDGTGTALGGAFTPDGKTLIVPCRGQTVRVYELETGALRTAGSVSSNPNCFAMSNDGRLFALAGTRSFVAVVDWRGMSPRKEPPDDAALNRFWAELASDTESAFSVVVEFGAAPDRAAKFIGETLKPVTVVAPGVIKGLIADLGSEEYAVREAAEKQLAALGIAAEAAVREAVKSEDPERRDRAGRLLKGLSGRVRADQIRALRAIEVLEYADTPAGRAVLAKLAEGEPSARLTRDAKAALDRLRASEPKP